MDDVVDQDDVLLDLVDALQRIREDLLVDSAVKVLDVEVDQLDEVVFQDLLAVDHQHQLHNLLGQNRIVESDFEGFQETLDQLGLGV